MHVTINMFCIFTDIIITADMPFVIVLESVGNVSICFRVIEGSIEAAITFNVYTTDGLAKGKSAMKSYYR